MVDTTVSKTVGATRGGSSPPFGTNYLFLFDKSKALWLQEFSMAVKALAYYLRIPWGDSTPKQRGWSVARLFFVQRR